MQASLAEKAHRPVRHHAQSALTQESVLRCVRAAHPALTLQSGRQAALFAPLAPSAALGPQCAHNAQSGASLEQQRLHARLVTAAKATWQVKLGVAFVSTVAQEL